MWGIGLEEILNPTMPTKPMTNHDKEGKKKIKYPAMFTVHWPTGPVNACYKHANGLRGLASMLGSHVAVTEAPNKAECSNCINESKLKKDVI